MAADRTFVAWFPTEATAIAFEARLNEGRDWVANVARKGRTVTFERAIPEGHSDDGYYFTDKLELVGYFGSTQSRKAKLNGIPAPFVW